MRLTGLDIARFIAFCGMVLVNFRIAAQVADSPDFAGQFTHLLEGRAAALFIVLAGVGISLAAPSAALLAKRALFLFAIGLLNQVIFEADILHYYGVYFLCVIPLLHLPPRGFLIVSAAILTLSFLMLIGLDYEAGWNWETLQYTGFWTPTGFIRNLFYNGWHPVFPWLAFLTFGLWLGRLELTERKTQIKLLIWGSLATVLFFSLSMTLSTDPELAEVFGLSPIPPGPLYILAGAATSTAAIGAILFITPHLTRLKITPWLAAPGRQTLTLYVGHILVGMGLLQAMGRLDGSLSSLTIFIISLGFIAITSLYAVIWSRITKRGPLETLMRLITQGNKT